MRKQLEGYEYLLIFLNKEVKSMRNSNECKPMLVIYTTDDVCKMFHLGKVKCLELFRRDDFPAQKYGRGYGVEAEALKKYMSTRHILS